MLRLTSALTAAVLVGTLAASTAADAQTTDSRTKHRVHRQTTTHAAAPSGRAGARPMGLARSGVDANERSFLDPGKVPLQRNDGGAHCVQAVTSLSQIPNEAYTNRRGDETLPRPFEIPTDQGPLFEFWTPAFR